MNNAQLPCQSPAGHRASNTFLIKVLYTQHNSTQGTIQWVDEEKTISFRSFLELVCLMKEALEKQGDKEEFWTWEKPNQAL